MTTRRFADPDEPRVRLSAPPDILATIPFLVGYHPTDSVVVLGMRGRRLTFTARDDLPAAGAEVSAGTGRLSGRGAAATGVRRRARRRVRRRGTGDPDGDGIVRGLRGRRRDREGGAARHGRTLRLVPVPQPGLLPTRRACPTTRRRARSRRRGHCRAGWRGGTGPSTRRRSNPPLGRCASRWTGPRPRHTIAWSIW